MAGDSRVCAWSASIPAGDCRRDRCAAGRRIAGYFSTDDPEPGSSITPKAIASASANRRHSLGALSRDRGGADRRRFPVPDVHAVSPRDLGQAAGQRAFNPISALTGGTLEDWRAIPRYSKVVAS
jgi:hypothetical protein